MCVRPTRRFNPGIDNELTKKTAIFSEVEKNVTIFFDEMKIQEYLVWNKHSGELIGFVIFGDNTVNFATLKNDETLVNPLSYSLVHLPQMELELFEMPTFW